MVFLDSDIIIDFLKAEEYAKKIVGKYKGGNLSVTSINSFELFKGFSKYQNEEKIKKFNLFFSWISVKHFDLKASRKAAEIFNYLKKQGTLIDLADIMIAAVVIVNNDFLITRNVKHFRKIPEVRILDLE